MSLLQGLKAPGQIFYGWWVVLACSAIGAYGGGLYFYGFTLFFKPLAEDLELSRASTSLVFSLSRMEGAFEGVIVGWAIDRFGPRRIMFLGVAMAGVGFILLSQIVHSFLTFVLVYIGIIALGVNMGFFHPALATVNNWFIRRKGGAMGVVNAALGIGGAVFVPVLGWIITSHGWRTAALLGGVVMLVTMLPVVLVVRGKPEDMGLRPDGDPMPEVAPVGAAQPDGSLHGGHGAVDDYGGQGGTIDFTVREAFRTVTLWIMMVGMTLRFFAQPAVIVHLAPLLTDRGMSPVEAGGVIGLLSLVSIPGRIAAGWLGDRFPKRYVMVALMGLDVLALFVLVVATEVWHLYLFVLLFGSGYGAGILNWALLGEYYGRAWFASLRGTMGLFYTWGGVLGPVFAGWIYDTTLSYNIALVSFVGVYFLAGIAYFFCVPPKAPERYRTRDTVALS